MNEGRIVLTIEEEALLGRIRFGKTDHDSVSASLEPAAELARSLIERGAIPPIRWRYFVDPELNIGSKFSRKEQFEKNETSGPEILRDPNFLRYLRYFMFGPNLPTRIRRQFGALIDDLSPVTSGDIQRLRQFARDAVRQEELERLSAAEELFKLALEAGLGVAEARQVRDAAMAVRR